MPTIVVGYDGSPASRLAIDRAIDRAGPDGKLIVVHSYHVPAEYLGGTYYEDPVYRHLDAASAVMDDVATVCPRLSTVEWEPDVIQGEPAETLCRVARHRGASEIVIGSRGVGRFRGLLGSVAHEVLH